jgi:ribosomal-protein-alanine N-acetyltransferase
MTVQSSVAIRPLAYSDLPQVMAIERRSFPTPWSLSMFVLELSRPSGVCLAAAEEGDEGRRGITGRLARPHLLGYVICSEYGDGWHIMNIAVDPGVRRRGLATALLEELFARAGHDRGYTLEVRTSNSAAIALYERFGFRPAGLRKRYYQDTGEDALIMWRVPGAAVGEASP